MTQSNNSQRYLNSGARTSQTGLKVGTAANNWNSSTRVNPNLKKQRENSASSQNLGTTPVNAGGATSVPRNVAYANPAITKDRSMNRSSLNLTGTRGGAHSNVGLNERWANAAKRSSNLNISQDMGTGELANQKNTPGDSSPRLSRSRVSMNNLGGKPEKVAQAVDP